MWVIISCLEEIDSHGLPEPEACKLFGDENPKQHLAERQPLKETYTFLGT